MTASLALFALLLGAPDLAALSARTQPAVVKLVALDARGEEEGSGTGFLVSTGGRVVTNHHVIDDASQMVAIFQGGRRVPVAGVLARDAENDLAVLQLEAGEYPALGLGELRQVVVGSGVIVIGAPIGFEGTLSTASSRRSATPARSSPRTTL